MIFQFSKTPTFSKIPLPHTSIKISSPNKISQNTHTPLPSPRSARRATSPPILQINPLFSIFTPPSQIPKSINTNPFHFNPFLSFLFTKSQTLTSTPLHLLHLHRRLRPPRRRQETPTPAKHHQGQQQLHQDITSFFIINLHHYHSFW